MVASVLPPLPASLRADDGELRHGLFAGDLRHDPVRTGPTRGRVRRWRYVAAGDRDTLVGAAVVDLGYAGVAFAFAAVAGQVAMWEMRRPLARGVHVGRIPSAGADASGRDGEVEIGGDGGFRVDVVTPDGRLQAEVRTTAEAEPAVLVTPTPVGGWNATSKVAGFGVAGEVRLGDDGATLVDEAGGWSDWTAGRQDRTTRWRWAAGAGITADGRRVGVNASTGMNGAGPGEDVVWWDGTPHLLTVDRLEPTGEDPAASWQLTGPGARCTLTPAGSRRADERFPGARSTYVQPFGVWQGRLAGPDGREADVTLAGVAEDHLAVW
jgi:hypothetical protein